MVSTPPSEIQHVPFTQPSTPTYLMSQKKHAKVAAEHRKWLPKVNRMPAPGSRNRVLIYKDGKANWEGRDIGADEPIPEI
jgi:hypothetical protein